MAAMSYHISSLLEKMQNSDKDFRFMATNDLMMELQKDSIKLDDDSEKKVVRMLLKLLEDKNGEVQNLAVKCLGPLVNKVKEGQVDTIVDCLCTSMVSGKEQLRDISSMGLKTVISDLPPGAMTLAGNICKRITPRLTAAVEKQKDISVQLEALDILGDLLGRFGVLLVSFHATIQRALLPQLVSPRLAVRKRSIMAISYLVVSSNGTLFKELMEYLLTELSANENTSTTRSYIQCIGAVSRHAGHRLGEYMDAIIPLMTSFCSEGDEELGEYCLQAFESFLLRCPREITPFVQNIVRLCLGFLVYDPNYNYGDDEEAEDANMGMDLEDDDEDDDDDEEDYSDDDDLSWKVRRSAAKCLTAVVGTRRELLTELYIEVAPILVSRFKEREENVKSDIFTCYRTLLQETRPIAAASAGNLSESMDSEQNPVSLLQSQVTRLVKAVCRQLKEKSLKTKQDCFRLLTQLVIVLPNSLTKHIMTLLPGINFSLSDKSSSSNMKIEALNFLNTLLLTHDPTAFHQCIHLIVPPVVTAVGDAFYKITSEALLVIQHLVRVLRPADSVSEFKFEPYVDPIYKCTLARLKASDIDQEVKERAISCMSQIIHSLGDSLSPELENCLPIYVDRLKNEITRLTAVTGLTLIASSQLKINLNPYLPEAIPLMATFLRKSDRSLKTHTLVCLNTLANNYPNSFREAEICHVVRETPVLLVDTDFYIAQLSLVLLTSMCRAHPQVMGSMCSGPLPQSGNEGGCGKSVLEELLKLTKSTLLQGAPLSALISFLSVLCSSGSPQLSFSELVQRLTHPIYTEWARASGSALSFHKQAFHSIAKCVARLVTDYPGQTGAVIQKCVADLSTSNPGAVSLFSLLLIGEIGREINLEAYKGIEEVFLSAFSSPVEEVKTAASHALGNVAVGNLSKYLPFVLSEITRQPKRQYLLLHSLKEIISCESNSSVIQTFKPYISTIWSMLSEHCACPEEGIRNVVAECMGKLTLLDPVSLLPKLKDSLSSSSPLTRATVVMAVKFTIAEQALLIDSLLKEDIGHFLATLQDPEINVRRVALGMLNSCAHNKPSLIRDLLPTLLPWLYNETKIRKELIREVEMGPFKHTVDDGLDLRKAGFECMYALLEQCLDRLDVFEFLEHVESGLKDHYDVQMLTYLMLTRLSQLCPSGVLQRMGLLVDPLKQTCLKQVKPNSVKQEFEKQDELKRSALRAVSALVRIPDALKCQPLSDFMSHIRSTPELHEAFESVQRDSISTHHGSGVNSSFRYSAASGSPPSMDTS